MKILLTGANGQVGKEVQIAAPKEFELIALTHQTLDITHAESVENICNYYQPDLILNAAAYTAVDRAEKEPEHAYAVNATGVRHLADMCKHYQIPLIHLSTDYVFDGSKDEGYTEEDTTSPLNVYGKTKLAGENIITSQLDQYIILRTSWVFSEHGNNFVKTILRLDKEKKELRVVADQVGCPTSAKNIAEVLWKIIKKIDSGDSISCGIYHYANVPAVSWYEFSKAILPQELEIFPITTAEYPTPAKRPANSILSCKKIEENFAIGSMKWLDTLQNLLHRNHYG